MITSRQKITTGHIRIGSYIFERVENFKYLGVIVNSKNNRSVEIQERIQAGNRAYWTYKKLLQDRNISRNTKLMIYRAAIRPVTTYASETMSLTSKDEENLRIFERKILRKLVGTKRIQTGEDSEEYRQLWNNEIYNILQGETIIKHIKIQRLRWLGHIERREKTRLIRKIKNWRPLETRPRGRPKSTWENQVWKDIRKLQVTKVKNIITDRKKWTEVISGIKDTPM